MHLRCSHSLTPNVRGCCGASPLALRARRNFFARGPPFYTQLADLPRAHMGPVGFSRGGNGALDRGPLCEGVFGHPRPAQPTVGPSAVVVGHPFVLAPSGFRLRSGVRRIPRRGGCGGRSDPRALRAPSTWVTRTGTRRRAGRATAVSCSERGVQEGADGGARRVVAKWELVRGCVVLVAAETLGRSRTGVVQRGDAPGARAGSIWGFGLVSFVLMAGLQLRAEGRRGVGCRGGWAKQINTGA